MCLLTLDLSFPLVLDTQRIRSELGFAEVVDERTAFDLGRSCKAVSCSLHAKGLRRQAWPTSGEVVTEFQSDSSRTDLPVRVLHAQPRSPVSLERGNGFALIDPHGDLVARIAARVPASQRDRVIYLNTTDPAQLYGYNPLRHVSEDRIALAASGMMDVFKKMWPDAWGVRMEHILRNVLMALLEQSDATLHDVLRIFSDNNFRKNIAKSLRNETVRTFLLHEFERFSFGYRADGTAPIQNKVGAFLADPLLNRILTAPEKNLHIRRIMDQGQVLLVNLAKGHIGEDSSSLLGGLLVTTIGLAAFSRADTPPAERRPFFVYIDEFQSFTTLALANMLSELRKYRVGFTLAHQYLHQLELDIRHAVLGNAGTIISFRVGVEDAPYLAREFQPKFAELDLLQLPNYRIYLKLMIDGTPSTPFSAVTLGPGAL